MKFQIQKIILLEWLLLWQLRPARHLVLSEASLKLIVVTFTTTKPAISTNNHSATFVSGVTRSFSAAVISESWCDSATYSHPSSQSWTTRCSPADYWSQVVQQLAVHPHHLDLVVRRHQVLAEGQVVNKKVISAIIIITRQFRQQDTGVAKTEQATSQCTPSYIRSIEQKLEIIRQVRFVPFSC